MDVAQDNHVVCFSGRYFGLSMFALHEFFEWQGVRHWRNSNVQTMLFYFEVWCLGKCGCSDLVIFSASNINLDWCKKCLHASIDRGHEITFKKKKNIVICASDFWHPPFSMKSVWEFQGIKSAG